MDFWHVGLNMYVLYNFGSIVIKTVGIPAFAGIYVGAGLLGSMASISWHVLTKMPHYSSLGASASLLGIIVTFAMYEPNARFKVILSPDSLSFNALNGIIGLVIFDTCGLLLRWKFLDHAAHLTGAAFGFLSWNIVKRIYGTSDDGQLCINGQYMFEGKYKDFKINDKYGKIYSPTKTYFGEMLINNQFSFDGKGCLRNELNGSVFYGYFNNGYIDGIGLLCLSNGKIFPAEYDRKNKDFKIPNNFDPTQLKGLLNKDINVIPFIQQNPNHKEIKESKEESKESQDIQNPNDTSSSSSSSTNPVTTQPKQQPLPS